MVWNSKTGEFGEEEMALMEQLSAIDMIDSIAGSDPIVSLRLLAEVMLNGDEEKLKALLSNPVVQESWKGFDEDYEVTKEDYDYARQLQEKIDQKD